MFMKRLGWLGAEVLRALTFCESHCSFAPSHHTPGAQPRLLTSSPQTSQGESQPQARW